MSVVTTKLGGEIKWGTDGHKIGSSIGSTWVGAGAAFDESDHSEVRGGPRGADGHKISLFLGAWFSCDKQKDRRRVSSLIWVVLNERLAFVGGNCLQGSEGLVHRRRVLGSST